MSLILELALHSKENTVSNGVKRLFAFILLTAWVLLSGVCFSEEFGFFTDTPECNDQIIEHALSIPPARVSISEELQEILNNFRKISVSFLLNSFYPLPSVTIVLTFVVLFSFACFHPPGKCRLSILRI